MLEADELAHLLRPLSLSAFGEGLRRHDIPRIGQFHATKDPHVFEFIFERQRKLGLSLKDLKLGQFFGAFVETRDEEVLVPEEYA